MFLKPIMLNRIVLFAFTAFIFMNGKCGKDAVPIPSVESMYFPNNTDNNWETKTLESLGWNTAGVQPLRDYLVQKNTKALIILQNGRIVMEEYYNGHNAATSWQWNSAGKTLVATLTGIAQDENLLNINNAVSQYLGNGWTSAGATKEPLIKVKNLLSMNSGLNDANEFVSVNNLSYVADAGTRWSYHNVFQKLMDVVASTSNQSFENYYNAKIKNKLGMEGFWNLGLVYKIYHSNARSMARFGLMALNKGKWKNEQIVSENYFNESINTSQSINPAYGYLWWLNGKSSYMVPTSQNNFLGNLVPNAPADMYAAMGAADQRIYVVPSKKLVIVRMGEASDPQNPNFAVSGFDNNFWAKLNDVIR
jgi:CubicO group peptidase (beta-lactamase class C family)